MSIYTETMEQNIIVVKDEELEFFEGFTKKHGIYWPYESKQNKVLSLNKSLVGYINTPIRTLSLLPKYHEIGFEHIVRMYLYLYGYRPTDNAAILDVSFNGINEDIVDIFVSSLKQNIQEGIIRFHDKQIKHISSLKGRVNFKESFINIQLLKRKPIVSKVPTLSMNNVYNNMILTALMKLRNVERYTSICNELAMYFEGANSNITNGSEVLESIVFNSNTARYRKTLLYASMIIDNLSYNDYGRHTGTDSFLINFDRLFEEFVLKILKEVPEKREFSTWPIKRTFGNLIGQFGKYDTRKYQPDLLYRFIEEDERFENGISAYAVLDVKNKAYSQFKNSDLYQILTYAKLLHSKIAFLLYPAFQKKVPEKIVLDENIFIPSVVFACFINIADTSGENFLKSIELFVKDIINIINVD